MGLIPNCAALALYIKLRSITPNFIRPYKSFRKLSTGFAIADLMACVLTVKRVDSIVIAPAVANIQKETSVRYAKFCSQLFSIK